LSEDEQFCVAIFPQHPPFLCFLTEVLFTNDMINRFLITQLYSTRVLPDYVKKSTSRRSHISGLCQVCIAVRFLVYSLSSLSLKVKLLPARVLYSWHPGLSTSHNTVLYHIRFMCTIVMAPWIVCHIRTDGFTHCRPSREDVERYRWFIPYVKVKVSLSLCSLNHHPWRCTQGSTYNSMHP
jgi:uncharacterized membrane protein